MMDWNGPMWLRIWIRASGCILGNRVMNLTTKSVRYRCVNHTQRAASCQYFSIFCTPVLLYTEHIIHYYFV